MYYSFYFGLMTDFPCRFIRAVAYRWILRWHRSKWDGEIRDFYWHIFMRTWGSVIRLHMHNQEDTNILNAWSNYLHIIFWVRFVSDISINWLCSQEYSKWASESDAFLEVGSLKSGRCLRTNFTHLALRVWSDGNWCICVPSLYLFLQLWPLRAPARQHRPPLLFDFPQSSMLVCCFAPNRANEG